nr:hypothetical protein [uncultured Hyphomonas sp.]
MPQKKKILGSNVKSNEVAPIGGDGNFSIKESLTANIQLTDEIIEAAKSDGLRLEDWVAQRISRVMLGAETSVSFSRDSRANISVDVRMPNKYADKLGSIAKNRKQRIPSLASRLIADFIAAHDDIDPQNLPFFETPRAGRIPAKLKADQEKLRNSLARIQVRLSDEEVDLADQLALQVHRGRQDLLGSIVISQLGL